MRRGLLYLLVFLILLATPIAIRYFRYNSLTSAERAAPPVYDPAEIAAVPTPPANLVPDDPTPGDGLVLLDQAHENKFELEEIAYLDSRLSARGFDLLAYDGGDLASALRPVNAFVVIAPTAEFDESELVAIERFVQRGGRLLLVGDPTRYNLSLEEDELFGLQLDIDTNEIPLNKLANLYDISFNGDYLYNTAENEGNFQNIIVDNEGISAEGLADGLTQLVVYGAHSLTAGPTAMALLSGDDNTWSSATDRPGGLVLAAQSGNEQVVAIGDIHFLTAPYYTVYDNSGLVARLADFLVDSNERGLVLADFPYFFQRPVDLVFSGSPELGPGAFDAVIAFQEAFRGVGGELNLAASAESDHDALYVGLYNQVDEDVAALLEAAGVELVIEPPIETEPADDTDEDADEMDEADSAESEDLIRQLETPLGTVQMSGMALILLDEADEQRQMVVLAASGEGLQATSERLVALVPLDGDTSLSDCLVQGNLALCPTGVAEEPVEAELITSNLPAEEDDDTDSAESDDDLPTIDVEYMDVGTIGLEDEVEDTLSADEVHAWVFEDGPAVIDITVDSAELDVVLQVIDADDQLLESSDFEGQGSAETITGLEIPDGDTYRILVSDYFSEGGDYTLSVTEGELTEEPEAPEGGGGVFIYSDDNGEPLADGFTSAVALADLLEPDFDVVIWSAAADGPLTEGILDGFDLFIWTSGDYVDEEGFFSEETNIIFDYIEDGGRLFVMGASPTLFGPIELAPLSDLTISAEGGELVDGLSDDPIELTEEIDSALTDSAEPVGPDATVFLLRGPDSEGEGNVSALAALDPSLDDQQSVFLFFPFMLLPEDVQTTLLGNLIEWFGL